MQEIELKYQVPPTARRAVAAAVAGRSPARRQRLQARYFDTEDRRLAQEGLALRVRREGRLLVQTLKGAAHDGMTRAEHNVPLTAHPADPELHADTALHAGTPVGDRLLELMSALAPRGGRSGHSAGPDLLACRFQTDVWRRSRQLRAGTGTTAGRVELAFDEGVVSAGERSRPICELEIESVSGAPQAVIVCAARWVARHGLWLDTRSKAERGDLLARSLAIAPPRHAGAIALHASMDVATGYAAVLADCVRQVTANASQVADGDYSADHLHQLRVGLRRLRSALRLFAVPTSIDDSAVPHDDGHGVDAAPAALAALAAQLFRQLGAARDADAVTRPLAAALEAAMRSIGLAADAALRPAVAEVPDPVVCVRGAPAQRLLLGLLLALQQPPDASVIEAGSSVRDVLSARLQRWHRQLKADARRFESLDDASRHRLRKRAKRLRYAVEFSAALYSKRAVQRYLKPLRRLQERLGELNDLAVGIERWRDADAEAAQAVAGFALGWLASQRASLLERVQPDIAAFAEARRFWKS